MFFCPLDGTLLAIGNAREQEPRGPDPEQETTSISPTTSRLGGGPVTSFQHAGDERMIFLCSTCPYSAPIRQKTRVRTRMTPKKVDDVLGGAEAWEHVDRTQAVCPTCHHPEAYYLQIQIRSADEPMSVFYKCVSCGHQWSDR